MKHRKALTTILGVIIAVSFYLFYVIILDGKWKMKC